MPKLSEKWVSRLGTMTHLLIIWSMISLALETEPSMAKYKFWFEISEIFVLIFFTGEYLMRIFWAEKKWKYIFSVNGIIDLLAILPTFVSFFTTDIRIFTACRLLRLLRIGKLYRYNKPLQTLLSAMREVKELLVLTLAIGLLLLYVGAMVIYHVEHDAQPEAFSSMLNSLWWAIVSYTTVGYGDISPVTAVGKLFAGISFYVANGVIGLPPVIIGGAVIKQHMDEKRSTEEPISLVCTANCEETEENDVMEASPSPQV